MRGTTAFWLGVALHALFMPHAIGQSQPVVKYSAGIVSVTGLNATTESSINYLPAEKWSDILRVYTHEAFSKKLNQAVGGSYTWYGDSLSFKPYFGFATGESYHCFFNYPTFLRLSGNSGTSTESAAILEYSFLIPERKYLPTQIASLHPQIDELPENMLRMYIYFSAPMMPGEAYDHIKLQTYDGKTIEKAFLIVDSELWDAERKRFTLLFDPGRVKRGLRANVEMGAPLKSGLQYQLIIDSAWRDAHGNALGHSYKKSFTVAAAQRTKLSTRKWKLETPAVGTRQDLLITFDRPVDQALALKYIAIASPTANPQLLTTEYSRLTTNYVNGKATLINSTQLQFSPEQPWVKGEYQVEVNPLFEDVCGNNLNNPFDVDLSKAKRVDSSEAVKLMFVVK